MLTPFCDGDPTHTHTHTHTYTHTHTHTRTLHTHAHKHRHSLLSHARTNTHTQKKNIKKIIQGDTSIVFRFRGDAPAAIISIVGTAQWT
jgi:hypothetical protein